MMDTIVYIVDITSIMECNMKLITVKFVKDRNIYSPGEYVFRAEDSFPAQIGDVLRDERYSDRIKIVKIQHFPQDMYYYKGFRLVTLSSLYTKITEKAKQDMEKRNIQVSLEEARNWYNGKDNTLKRLALQVYTEEELNKPQSYSKMLNNMGISHFSVEVAIDHKFNRNIDSLSDKVTRETMIYAKMMVIAYYLHKNWTPKLCDTKYFIGMYSNSTSIEPEVVLGNGYGVFRHTSVWYPGIVYFKTVEEATEAWKLMNS